MYDFNINMKFCRYCGERIEENRSRCPFCASLLNRPAKIQVPQRGPVTFNTPPVVPAPVETELNGEFINTSVNNENTMATTSEVDVQELNLSASEQYEPNPVEINQEVVKTETINTEAIPVTEANIAVNQNQSNGLDFSKQVMPKSKKISNGLKVFLTILCTIIPFIGSVAGIITGTIFMNSSEDVDRRTFGSALFVASLILFIFSFIVAFIIYLGTML